MSIYDQHLDKCRANYRALSPLSFIERSAQVFPNHPAQVYENIQYSWKQTYERCRRLASGLAKLGVGYGDTVSIIAANIPAHYEIYFGVPMLGAVANGLNTRLDAAMLAFQLDHAETKVLLVDTQFHKVMKEALALAKNKPIVIDVIDHTQPEMPLLGKQTYEDLLAGGDPDYAWRWPEDEWEALSLNYTSGTTGDPKGVVYQHRGAFLNGLGNALAFNNMANHPVYLWTLPIFHASGWCMPWTISALAGTNIFMRKVEAGTVFELIEKHGVTHFTAAPVVLNMLINAPDSEKRPLPHKVQVMTAASPPPAPVLAAMQRMGFEVTHVYGATEAFGPNMSCAWHNEWNALDIEEQARLKARQGVRTQVLEDVIVGDADTCAELPWDGESIGEVLMSGNTIMKGYLKNPKTTEKTFKGGWYHTGDLAVRHPDGYIELKDRLKDIIISGGENIPSVEVEAALYRHEAVLEVAVVARPHEHWGEVPCAFVELKAGKNVSEEELISFAKKHLAGYKCPKHVVFGPLDKTATGKIQKYLLRERAKNL